MFETSDFLDPETWGICSTRPDGREVEIIACAEIGDPFNREWLPER